jgi:Xaa-Pro aminopeptidase
VIRKLHTSGAQALLVTNFKNVSYLTGFSGDDSYLLLGKTITLLISDTRYEVQIAEECPGLEAHIRNNRTKMHEAVATVLKQAKLTQLGFESSSTTVEQWEQLRKAADRTEFVPLAGLVEDLRQVKDHQEVMEIREAISQAERGFAVLRASLVGEMTELEAAHNLEHAMRKFGAKGAAFDPIVAVGPRSALPHARPSHAQICESDLLLVDWGATNLRGYKSDLTRVLVTGRISPKLEKLYQVVLNAQRAGIEAIRPGVRGCDVDQAARSVIEKAGYGKRFGHGLGHGFGLDIHEEPRLSPVATAALKPGMIVTVEPGIYLPGWGGLRIEDDVLVTRDGHEVLTSVAKNLEDVVVN